MQSAEEYRKQNTKSYFSNIRITGVTVGKIVDYGLKDSQNMGACMAPATMDTIVQNFQDMERKEKDYDRIITGDLGSIGRTILFDLIREKGYDICEKHMDCGMTIFDKERQDTHAGGSGCGCAAVTLASYVLPKLEKRRMEAGVICSYRGAMSTRQFQRGGERTRGSLTELFWKAMHSIRKLKSKKIEGKMIKSKKNEQSRKEKG